MQFSAIDATLQQLKDQLPKAQTRGAADVFQSLIDSLSTQIKAAIADASEGTATESTSGTVPPHTTSALTPFQQSLLKSADAPMYAQLSNELTADSSLYNERESLLRDGLDVAAIEQRLRASARNFGVEYDQSDLDGILRNAGYGAAHLGSTERYLSSVESFIGEAEKNYRQRAGNTPGATA
jgi:hypothetical protein